MLKELGTKTIETNRLILRKFTMDDTKDMYNNWGSDPETSKMLPWDVHENEEVTRELLTEWTKGYDDNMYFKWVVEIKDNNEIIGDISVVKNNKSDKVCEIGYCYGSKYWGEGYATEALRAVLEYLLNDVGYRLVQAKHISGNPASGKVMSKSGMKYDATLRSRIINKDTKEPNDLIIYSIMKDEL